MSVTLYPENLPDATALTQSVLPSEPEAGFVPQIWESSQGGTISHTNMSPEAIQEYETLVNRWLLSERGIYQLGPPLSPEEKARLKTLVDQLPFKEMITNWSAIPFLFHGDTEELIRLLEPSSDLSLEEKVGLWVELQEIALLHGWRSCQRKKPIHKFRPLYRHLPVLHITGMDTLVKKIYSLKGRWFFEYVCTDETKEPLRPLLPFSDNLKRVVSDHKWASIGMGSLAVITTVVLGAIGAACGAAMGGNAGIPVGGILGTIIGGGIMSFVLGGVTSLLVNGEMERRIKNSEIFSNWGKGEPKERYDLAVLYLRIVSSMPVAASHIQNASLPQFIPEIPVTSPNGDIYERDHIEAYLDREHSEPIWVLRPSGEVQSVLPFSQGEPSFRKENLQYAFDFAEEFVKKVELVRNALQGESYDALAGAIRV